MATYFDSSGKSATNRRQGAQVDKDGYVYYNINFPDFREAGREGNSWQWDNNEYMLLIESGITAYKLLDIQYDFTRATKHERMRVRHGLVGGPLW